MVRRSVAASSRAGVTRTYFKIAKSQVLNPKFPRRGTDQNLLEDKAAEGGDEFGTSVSTDRLFHLERLKFGELPFEIGFLERDVNLAHGGEVFGGGHLMFVTMLTEAGAAGHDQDRFTVVERAENGAHSGVGDDGGSADEAVVIFGRVDELGVLDVGGPPVGFANLGEDILALVFASPLIDDFDHAIEGEISADSDEDHRGKS